MVISSTEFQQNVGYYLKEAQRGKIVQIRKSKPGNVLFNVSVQKEDADVLVKKISRREQMLALINKLNIHDDIHDSNSKKSSKEFGKESGLEFQKRVRD
jgi:hypothetical protein